MGLHYRYGQHALAGMIVIIPLLGLVVAGYVRYVHPSIKEILHQNKNDHDENLRDALDRYQAETMDELRCIREQLREHSRSLDRHWQRTADLGSRDDRLGNRLAVLAWVFHDTRV